MLFFIYLTSFVERTSSALFLYANVPLFIEKNDKKHSESKKKEDFEIPY